MLANTFFNLLINHSTFRLLDFPSPKEKGNGNKERCQLNSSVKQCICTYPWQPTYHQTSSAADDVYDFADVHVVKIVIGIELSDNIFGHVFACDRLLHKLFANDGNLGLFK